MRLNLFCLALTALFTQLSIVSTVSAASEVGANEKYKNEINILETASRSGDTSAQSTLGIAYFNGEYVKQDYARAASLCKSAADQGNAKGMACLGTLYFYGYALPKDIVKALKLFRSSEELGGFGFGDLVGGMPDDATRKRDAIEYNTAAEALRRSAEQGDVEAQATLGFMYLNFWWMPYSGSPYSPNHMGNSYKQAEGWLLKAAENGHSGAQLSLGLMYEVSLGLAFQIPDNQVLAAKWLEKSAISGNTFAQLELARIYSGMKRGRNASKKDKLVTPNESEALKWATKAADKSVAAQSLLGSIYLTSEKLHDYKKARFWLEKAAPFDLMARTLIGFSYERGYGVEKDNGQAIAWYRKASDEGYPLAVYRLGTMYERGLGVPKDTVQALAYYELAADHIDQRENLYAKIVSLYEAGPIRDDKKLLHYYHKAGSVGDKHSMRKLVDIYGKGLLGVKSDSSKAKYWSKRVQDTAATR